MKLLATIFLLIFCFKGQSQQLLASNASVESCNDQANCLTVANSALLYYDESTSQFYLHVDFGDFRKGADTNDNWLNRVKDTVFYFKAMMAKELFPPLGNQAAKGVKLHGEIFYNNTWKEQDIEMEIVTSENSVLDVTNPHTNFNYDSYKITFNIPFVPKDFKVYKKLYYNNQTVNVTVTQGRINLLRPGMEGLLQGAYYQASR